MGGWPRRAWVHVMGTAECFGTHTHDLCEVIYRTFVACPVVLTHGCIRRRTGRVSFGSTQHLNTIALLATRSSSDFLVSSSRCKYTLGDSSGRCSCSPCRRAISDCCRTRSQIQCNRRFRSRNTRGGFHTASSQVLYLS